MILSSLHSETNFRYRLQEPMKDLRTREQRKESEKKKESEEREKNNGVQRALTNVEGKDK